MVMKMVKLAEAEIPLQKKCFGTRFLHLALDRAVLSPMEQIDNLEVLLEPPSQIESHGFSGKQYLPELH